MRKIPPILLGALFLVTFLDLQAAPTITEFVASNSTGLTDVDGEFSDWIEIHNPDGAAINLDGYSLTDDSGDLTRWELPAVSIDPGDYLVVFASGKNRNDPAAELHTNFRLSATGGYLALVDADGTTVLSEFGPVYPQQIEDESFGIVTATGLPSFLNSPTPEAANSGGQSAGPVFVEFTDKPDRPIAGTDLVVTATLSETAAPVDAVTVRYRVMFGGETTLTMADDGVAPDALAGDSIYSATIPGAAFSDGEMIRWRFVADDTLGNETKEPAFRVALDSHQYVGTVAVNPAVDSLLPVVETFLQNPSAAETDTGTYGAVFYLGELYDNIRFNKHGQSTGGALFLKKSFNLDFNKTQRFRWHPDEKRVKDIDMLTNWADKSKARHVLAWEVMRESGVHGHFAFTVRVQQNGQFFGTADFVEDPDDIYLDRVGLNPDGALYKIYDNTLDTGNSTVSPAVEKKNRRDDNNQDLADFIAGLNQNNNNTTLQGQFIYDNVNLPMMVNVVAAYCVIRNTDIHRKNWYFYRDSGRSDEWAVLPWDLDLSHGRRWNSTDNYFDNRIETNNFIEGARAIHLIDRLWSRAETREMMYRRIRTLSDKFLNHPDTPYSERYYESRLDEILAQIDPPAIVPSDARRDFEKWGSWIDIGETGTSDSSGGTSLVPYTNTNVQVETMEEAVDRWKNEYLPGRRTLIYNNGSIPEAQSGQIPYAYTPLVEVGDLVRFKVATDNSVHDVWLDDNYDDSAWSAGALGVGFSNDGSYDPLIGAGSNVLSTMRGRGSSAYLRMEFEVADPSIYQALLLRIQFDDGYIAYLNGEEIHRQNFDGTPNYNSIANSTEEVGADELDVFDEFQLNSSVGELRVGTNVLAIQGLARSPGDSDFIIRPELLAGVPDSAGSVEPVIDFGSIEFNPASGNQDEEYFELVNNNNIAVDVSDWEISGGVEFTLAAGTVIPANSTLYVSPDVKTFRSRATSPTGDEQRFVVGGYKGHLSSFGESLELRDGAGALNNSTSYVGDPSDVQRYLIVSEIMYHPEPDGAAEFIELMNISDTVTLDLTGVQFTEGISFDFTGSAVTSLAPGERVLVVKDAAVFEAAHGAGLPVAGVFALDSSLSNGGESIKLEDAEGGTAQEFTYDDKSPWPTSPDTAGYSLILISPATKPDPSESSNWRASLDIGGSPGEGDGTTFSGDPNADLDGDGLSALVEYAIGSDDTDADSGTGATSTGSVLVGADRYATFSYRSSPDAADIDLGVETSTDLADWVDADGNLIEVGSQTEADGTVVRTVRLTTPMSNSERRYFRLRINLL